MYIDSSKVGHNLLFQKKVQAMSFLTKKSGTEKEVEDCSNAPYGDKIGTDEILIYEGHDIPKNKRGLDPKKIDQPMINKNGKPTRNGLFYNLTLAYKLGNSKPEVIKVYQKLAKTDGLIGNFCFS